MFYPGQPVVTRANNRTLRYGNDEWVRNGDRWTINAGTRDELYLTNTDTGDRLALPADYVAAGYVTVNYASTIHRAQGATVDEAHVIIDDRTDNGQLYVAAPRGRRANHVHTAPPTFDPDRHSPDVGRKDWTPRDGVAAALTRQPDATSAISYRQQFRPGGSSSRRTTPTFQDQAKRPFPRPLDHLDRGTKREIMQCPQSPNRRPTSPVGVGMRLVLGVIGGRQPGPVRLSASSEAAAHRFANDA